MEPVPAYGWRLSVRFPPVRCRRVATNSTLTSVRHAYATSCLGGGTGAGKALVERGARYELLVMVSLGSTSDAAVASHLS
jgi:hypothetical protein